MNMTFDEQKKLAEEVLGRMAVRVWVENGSVIAMVDTRYIIKALTDLRDHDETQLDVLTFMTAVDYTPREPRFTMVYELYSTSLRFRVRVQCQLADTGNENELPEIDSVSSVYRTAEWHERECYDLMGITFTGHPDLRRILLPENWDGHPLRKEYPFDGKRTWKPGCNVIDSQRMEGDLGL